MAEYDLDEDIASQGETDLNSKQLLNYARELSALYRSEKKKRTQLEKALEEIDDLRRQLEKENAYLREEVKSELIYDHVIGESPPMQKIMRQVDMVADTDVGVLIQGETGTGKELVARAIHERSRRSQRALVKVNCASIPSELFESEFFGHVKGAFSGAVRDRIGRFQLANEGTLFLDEVSEMPIELQGKLLRVIQEGQFERVGEDSTTQVNVRVIAATNRDLKNEIRAGRFREDLFYRLSVIPIEVPPLRQRVEDIPALAEYFLNKVCQKIKFRDLKLSEEQVSLLQAYPWPGNVRELQNIIERAVILSGDGNLHFDLNISGQEIPESLPDAKNAALNPTPKIYHRDAVKDFEKKRILSILEKTNWKIYGPRGAAELLHMKPTTLAYRMKRMGICRPT